MSEQDNTIRALQLQMQANAKKLDQLRAVNKKLRAELAGYQAEVKSMQFDFEQVKAESFVWREAHRQLAEAGR